RAVLWNAVEKIEKAVNSQLAREIELALPAELTREQNISLARDYVKEHFVSAGMCADVCIHDIGGGNPHAHVLLTMRPFNNDKMWGIKEKKDYALDENGDRIPIIDAATGLQKLDSRNRKLWKRVYVQANDWNNQSKAEEWRAAWEASANAALEKHGHESRIDHRSYERQGIEQIPTVHMGVAATQMEHKGIVTERGNMNREISRMNQILFAILAKLKQLKNWLKETVRPTANTSKTEKPAIMAQLNKYKKEIQEAKEPMGTEPSALDELRARRDHAHENLKHIDKQLKNANGLEEFDKIMVERRKTYNEYSALKAEVKRAESSLPQRKPRSRDMER
ncbi:MAG: MobA/MobL family protein, partial [Oscillospiraceae bacterium]|nr:MobA/MobL family protein [Oscillospiraceae bacterium]